MGSPLLIIPQSEDRTGLEHYVICGYLHERLGWMAARVKHEITLVVNVGQATGKRDTKLDWIRLFSLW